MENLRIVPQIPLNKIDYTGRKQQQLYERDRLALCVYANAVKFNRKLILPVGSSIDMKFSGYIYKFGADSIVTFWNSPNSHGDMNHFGSVFCVGVETIAPSMREYFLNFEIGFAFNQTVRSGGRPYYQFESNETIPE